MARTPHRRTQARGTTLLEAMIALTILLVGMVGMLQLQLYGMSTTQGARAQTIASELAVELANGLATLPYNDPRLTGSAAADLGPPTVFGALLPHGVPTGAEVHVYDDGTPVPYTRADAQLERDPSDLSAPIYRRRWTVWNAASTTSGDTAKVIAVSVIWRERTLARPREIVAYVHSELRGSFMADLNAFR